MGFSCFYTPPEYLRPTSTGLFIFRHRIPHDLREVIGKSELKYSLKTKCIRTARKYLASILPFLQDLFNDIRQGLYSAHSNENSGHIIKDRITQTRTDSLPHIPTPIPHQYTEAVVAIQNAPELPQVPPDEDIKSNSIKTPTITFSTITKAFFKEKALTNEWRLKTQEDHEQIFSLFVEVFEDVPVNCIDKPLLRDFKNTIMCLPPNMRKVKKYRNKTIPQIVAMKPEKTISSHTINKYLSRLSNLFTYAVSHGYIQNNPASGLKIKHKTRPDEERKAYTSADLQKLFREPATLHPYMYWTPIIALYSGCRLEEICQLHLEDIRQEDGVIVLDINDKEEKHLKTLSSERLIPIHPHLIDLGLLQYVYDLKAKGEKRLFPELRQSRDGYGQTVSKWFQRYKKRCGVAQGKTFHSLRHTFITHLNPTFC